MQSYPNDWKIVKLGDVADTASGGTPSRNIAEFYKGDIKWFTTSELRDCLLWDSVEHISSSALRNSSAKVFSSGTLLMAMYGATIGKLGILSVEAATNQACCAISCRSNCHMEYLYHFLLKNRREIVSLGSGAGQPNISQAIVRNIKIPLPPLPEQKRIAEVLSNVDRLIENTEKRIAKKRAIKQGAMQELLTGKKRLPGYSDKWIKKKLGDCALIKARIGWQGLTTAEYLESGPYYLITASDFKNGRIDWSKCHYVDQNRFNQDTYIQIKQNDILISKDGTIGKVAFLDDIPGEGTLNSGIFVIRSRDKDVEQAYLAWVFLSKWFDDFIDRLVAGSTIIHLYQKDIVHFEFFIPPTIEEQRKIVSFLTDVDLEICTLEKKLAKYKNIRQGMMQDLLTGKVRLRGQA